MQISLNMVTITLTLIKMNKLQLQHTSPVVWKLSKRDFYRQLGRRLIGKQDRSICSCSWISYIVFYSALPDCGLVLTFLSFEVYHEGIRQLSLSFSTFGKTILTRFSIAVFEIATYTVCRNVPPLIGQFEKGSRLKGQFSILLKQQRRKSEHEYSFKVMWSLRYAPVDFSLFIVSRTPRTVLFHVLRFSKVPFIALTSSFKTF